MSTFVVHLIIPALIIQTLGLFPRRYVWSWAWIGIAMDIDYLGWILYANHWVPINTHRALFHNVWLLLVLGWWATRRFQLHHEIAGIARWPAFVDFCRTKWGAGLVLSSYYYFAHILFDGSQGGVALLWPLGLFVHGLDFSFAYEFVLDVDTTTQRPAVHADVATVEGVVDVDAVYRWLDSQEFAFLVLLGATSGLSWLPASKWRRAKTTPASATEIRV